MRKINQLEAGNPDAPTHQKVRPIDPGIGGKVFADNAAGFTQGKLTDGG
jgi:hypothetical protein